MKKAPNEYVIILVPMFVEYDGKRFPYRNTGHTSPFEDFELFVTEDPRGMPVRIIVQEPEKEKPSGLIL